MGYTFERILYNERLDKLKETERWLMYHGIDTKNSRLSELLEMTDTIVEYQNRGDTERLREKYGDLKLWYALMESGAFVEVYDALKTIKSNKLPRAKLKDILKGPFLPMDEDTEENNIHGRNTLFELLMASKLINAGIKVTEFDDVDFTFQKTKFNIQCKRLHSQKRIRDNIEKASSQFYYKMKSKPNLKGIIGLSIDKIAGMEGRFIKVKNEAEIGKNVGNLTVDFIRNYYHYWHNLTNINIIAVFVFSYVVIFIEDGPYDLLTSSNLVDIDVIANPSYSQVYEYSLIRNLGTKLGATDIVSI